MACFCALVNKYILILKNIDMNALVAANVVTVTCLLRKKYDSEFCMKFCRIVKVYYWKKYACGL